MPNRFVFRNAFQRGYPQDNRVPRNSDILAYLHNLSATDMGAVPFRDVLQPITNAALTAATITKSFPWPQLFRGRKQTILMDTYDLYHVNESWTNPWTLSAQTIYDFTTYDWDADTALATVVPAGGSWTFMDMGHTIMLFNGNCIVFRMGFSDKWFMVDAVTIKTGALYMDGRAFFGGFDSADINALADWDTYLATLLGDVPAEYAKLRTAAYGPNTVWWSSIGMPDLLRFFSLDWMKYMSLASTPDTGFTDNIPFWQTLARRGESGFTHLPSTGTVRAIKPLGENVVTYTDTGVYILNPVNTELVKTFGVNPMPGLDAKVGVANFTDTPCAVGGDESVHLFMDELRDLWVVEQNRATRLGYRNVFGSASGSFLIHYDPQEGEFHIASGSGCYRLSKGMGLSRSPQLPTTVTHGRFSSASSALGVYIDAADPTTAAFETGWFDGGAAGTTAAIEDITVVGSSGWTLTMTYKRTPNDGEQTTGAVALDARNRWATHTSGVEFKVSGTHADRTTAKIQELLIDFGDGTRRSIKPWLT